MSYKKKLKNILINHFDEDNDQSLYLSGANTVHPSLREPYTSLENFFKSKDLNGKKVLDYCCGSGIFSILPARLGANVTGIDFSNNSIKKAKIRSKNFNVENFCNFLSEDVEEINAIEEGFDYIFVVDSLLYLDMKSTFIKLSKLLKNEGELILIEGLGSNPFFNLNRKMNINNYASGFEKELAKKTLNQIGKSFNEIFFKKRESYFGLLTSISYILEKKYKIKIKYNFFFYLDNVLKNIPFMRKYFFRCLLILKKIPKNNLS